MAKDVECPYCGEWQEICHDDGYGREEDEMHNQECSDCEKVFAYTTAITFHYDASKAECLNDGDHKWEKMTIIPAKVWPDAKHCTACGERDYGERVVEMVGP